MAGEYLKEILTLCRSIENSAEELYRTIATQTNDSEHRAFWLELAEDEKRHAKYWDELLSRVSSGMISHVFDHPQKTRDELKTMKILVDNLLREKPSFADVSEAIITGFRLESLMLHPAFCIMFHALKDESGNQSPEDDYQEHVDKFSGFVNKSCRQRSELEVLGEMLSRMWEHSRELANQFTQIKTLRGLIPICANCKKIREDDGFWNQIESYLEEKTDAQFTHGICPQCAETLYPDLQQP